jgi:hypothetical protein
MDSENPDPDPILFPQAVDTDNRTTIPRSNAGIAVDNRYATFRSITAELGPLCPIPSLSVCQK